MPDNLKNIVEVSVRLVFTPKALTALAAAILMVVAALFDVEWAKVLAFLPMLFLIITLDLAPVPTIAPDTRVVVSVDYASGRAVFPVRRIT